MEKLATDLFDDHMVELLLETKNRLGFAAVNLDRRDHLGRIVFTFTINKEPSHDRAR